MAASELSCVSAVQPLDHVVALIPRYEEDNHVTRGPRPELRQRLSVERSTRSKDATSAVVISLGSSENT
jgi:hypothetical protein